MNTRAGLAYRTMAAARYSTDVLRMFYGLINREENARMPIPLLPVNLFRLEWNNFGEWLRVWKMNVANREGINDDLFVFARETRPHFVALLQREIEELNSIKASFGLEVEFSFVDKNGNLRKMKHYFKGGFLTGQAPEQKSKWSSFVLLKKLKGT